MHTFSSLKQEFLKNWIKGLQICSSSKKMNMGIMEKKKVIKLSADMAMASARKGMTCWSRAVIGKATTEDNDCSKIIAENILGPERAERLEKASKLSAVRYNNRLLRSKKILKKSHNVRRALRKNVPRKVVAANSLAKRMVEKRTQVLKGLVPGGEFMDEVSLIEETLDYLVSLRAQVDVMRCVACATDLVNGK